MDHNFENMQQGNQGQGGSGYGSQGQGSYGSSGQQTQGGYGSSGQQTQGGYGTSGQQTQGGFVSSGQQTQGGYGTSGQFQGGTAYYAGQVPQERGKKKRRNRGDRTNGGKSGFGVTLAKTAAIALVFGLVSGLMFTGITFAGTKTIGASGSALESDASSGGENGNSSGSSAGGNSDGALQQTSTGHAADLLDVSAVVDAVMPSIVAITNTGTVTYQSFFGMSQSYETESCGSGIIVAQDDENIYIATNNHVVADAKSLAVTFFDDTVADGEIQGTDASDDLAVVRVRLKDIDDSCRAQIKVATLGNSDELKVGEATIAIGNALGYGQSVTTGVVSALGRTVTVSDSSTGATIVNNNLIQTDAAINPGNSGGALLNAKGEVIGINSVKYSDTAVEGIGYAIGMNDAMEIIDQLIETGVAYDMHTAYLGIQGKDMVDVSGNPAGVGIYSVMEGSGAAEADIQQNDILVALDGKRVDSMDNLKTILKDYSAGDQVKLTLLRRQDNGYDQLEVEVRLSSAQEVNVQQ
ncbi:MAG: trypsin-like peptidase domain-containing protein [Lachnospiraceae bacterium]|nr:trypsin-like peptidase domain-containing protein [Lachnospiraceae bacterium]